MVKAKIQNLPKKSDGELDEPETGGQRIEQEADRVTVEFPVVCGHKIGHKDGFGGKNQDIAKT